MDELWRAVVLGVVEGVTEFLPVSSTGHLIVVSDMLSFEGSLGGTFEIFIQLGAILAVVWFYARDLWAQLRGIDSDRDVQRFWLNLFVAFLPAAILGLLIHDWIKARLFSPGVVALSLVLGGIVLIVAERRQHTGKITFLYEISLQQAVAVGIAQVFALVPGVSRSGASIVGGLLAGLDRRTATTFSFYLAIPTLGSATIYDLLTSVDRLSRNDVANLAVGTIVSFFVALGAIGWLLRYVSTHSFTPFGVYRILAGLAVVAWWATLTP